MTLKFHLKAYFSIKIFLHQFCKNKTQIKSALHSTKKNQIKQKNRCYQLVVRSYGCRIFRLLLSYITTTEKLYYLMKKCIMVIIHFLLYCRALCSIIFFNYNFFLWMKLFLKINLITSTLLDYYFSSLF